MLLPELKTPSSATHALRDVLPQLYTELHRLAENMMRRERPSHTLQATALINEVYLLLVAQRSVNFNNRAQVLGVAAQMMRRILTNHHHSRMASKRGGDVMLMDLSCVAEPVGCSDTPFGLVDQLLDRLATLDERQARVVELRIFGGMTIEETADFLEVSEATISRDWATAKLWLKRELDLSA